MELVKPCKDLVLRGWGNIGPRNREVCLDEQTIDPTGRKASEFIRRIGGRDIRSRQRERRAHRIPRESGAPRTNTRHGRLRSMEVWISRRRRLQKPREKEEKGAQR